MTDSKGDSITTKLRKIQVELKAPKSQYNSFGKYNYRNVEDIQEAVKPLLAKYDCTLKLSDEIVLIGDRYYVKATASLKDDNGEEIASAFAREAQDKKGMDDAQLTGSVSSYARKYALGGLLAVDDNKDADSQQPAQAPMQQARPRPAVEKIAREQIVLMYQTMKDKGYDDREEVNTILTNFCDTSSLNSLTKTEATQFLNKLLAADKATLDTFFNGQKPTGETNA